MIYVCFATSPLHLICIKELAFIYKEDKFVIYCFVKNRLDAEYRQIRRTIEMLDLVNVHEVELPKRKIFQKLKIFVFAFYLFNKHKRQPTTFVIVDFRNTFMHFLRRLFPESRFILIDDGFATYNAYNDYIKFGYYLPYLQYKGVLGSLNKLIHFGFDFSRLLNKKIDLFTLYARKLKLTDNSYNSLSFVRKLTEDAMLVYSDKFVYFAGSRMAEKGILTMEEEIKLIMKVNKYWAKKGKKMIYVGKRVTKGAPSEYKIKCIEKKSIPVVFFDLPLELALIDLKPKMIPTTICSFESTLNTTLPILHPIMDSYLVDIKDTKEIHIEVKKNKIRSNHSF